MKKRFKKQWLTALRSGKYKQTKHYLRTDAGFCCLGVLCDVVKDKLKSGEDWTTDPITDNGAAVRKFGNTVTTLPDSVLDLVNLPSKYVNPTIHTLVRMNDEG